jgi:hypothetical protein
MIGLRELPGDVFRFDQERYQVVGHRTGRRFRLGDELTVTIKAVDMDRRTVDMALAEEGGPVTTSGKFVRRPSPAKASSKGTRGKAQTRKKGKR